MHLFIKVMAQFVDNINLISFCFRAINRYNKLKGDIMVPTPSFILQCKLTSRYFNCKAQKLVSRVLVGNVTLYLVDQGVYPEYSDGYGLPNLVTKRIIIFSWRVWVRNYISTITTLSVTGRAVTY